MATKEELKQQLRGTFSSVPMAVKCAEELINLAEEQESELSDEDHDYLHLANTILCTLASELTQEQRDEYARQAMIHWRAVERDALPLQGVPTSKEITE